tara:strand:+ start:342 stop:884 length:543 start_codon:yes stop_codon:yes gene_type:complete
MDNKETIKKVKALIFGEEEVAETFLDVKTSEGIVLRVAELKEGEAVMIISEDGEAQSGAAEYILEDGQTVSVDEAGLIVSIAEPAEEEEEVEEEMSEEPNPLDDRVTNLEQGIEKILSMFSVQIEDSEAKDKTISELSEKLEAFSKAPAEEEIVVKKKTPLEEKRYNAINELRNFNKTKK